MKPLTSKHRSKWSLPFSGMIIMLLSTFIIFSCNKKDQNNPIAKSFDSAQLSEMLNGELFSGRMEVAQEEDGVVFICNKGKDLLVLEKLSPAYLRTCGNIENGLLIYSQYGIIVKNVDTNEVWAYANNDSESEGKFKNAGHYMGPDPFIESVAGNIKLRIN